MARVIIDDRPIEMLTEEEKNEQWMKAYGKPYSEPTEEEMKKIRKEYDKYRNK